MKTGTLVAVATALPTSIEKIVEAQPIVSGADLFQIPMESESDPLFHYTRSTFQSYLNSIFEIRYGAAWLPLTLASVSDTGLPTSTKGKRQVTTDAIQANRLSLLFRGSADMPVGQDVYYVRHAALGSFRLLLVPVRSGLRDGLYYEAVINRVQK